MTEVPTEDEFFAWWQGRKDEKRPLFRGRYCPLALYLQSHGEPNAIVGVEGWTDGRGGYHVLPTWAKGAVMDFDSRLYEGRT